jgi:hypothetical protein
MFDWIGGKTKFFAALWAVVQALELSGVIPAESMETAGKLVEVVAQAGVLWGFRDAVAKIRA